MAFTSDTVGVFLAVIDCGSFSAAARKLGRVPSAISMTIAQLEAELDLQLFDRRGHQPVPTAAARALEPQARQLASQLRQLQAQALALHRGLEKRLSLAIAPELLSAPWCTPLTVLAQEYPTLEVEVLSAPQDDAVRLLHQGSVQLALLFERPTLDEREAFQELGSEVLIPVLAPSHPLCRQGRARLSQEQLFDLRQIVVASRDARLVDPRLVLSRHTWRSDSHLTTLSLVQSGLGWAFLPRTLVQPLLDNAALVELEFDNMSSELRLWVDVVWLTERPLGLAAQRYIELMRSRTPIQP